jgi:hypothetical protein
MAHGSPVGLPPRTGSPTYRPLPFELPSSSGETFRLRPGTKEAMSDDIHATQAEKEAMQRLWEEQSKRKHAEQSAEPNEGDKKPNPGSSAPPADPSLGLPSVDNKPPEELRKIDPNIGPPTESAR